MARLLKNGAIFVMIPRVGCMSTEAILKEQNLWIADLRGEERYWHPTPYELKKLDLLNDEFTFCFVRHPLSWLRSRWAYRKMEGIKPAYLSKNKNYIEPAQPLIDSCETFDGFLENYFDWCSDNNIGLVEKTFEEYTEGVTYVGKLEFLRNNLVQALTQAGETFDKLAIFNAPRINEASAKDEWKYKCLYTRKTAQRTLEFEKRAIRKYKYNNYAPESWLKEK